MKRLIFTILAAIIAANSAMAEPYLTNREIVQTRPTDTWHSSSGGFLLESLGETGEVVYALDDGHTYCSYSTHAGQGNVVRDFKKVWMRSFHDYDSTFCNHNFISSAFGYHAYRADEDAPAFNDFLKTSDGHEYLASQELKSWIERVSEDNPTGYLQIHTEYGQWNLHYKDANMFAIRMQMNISHSRLFDKMWLDDHNIPDLTINGYGIQHRTGTSSHQINEILNHKLEKDF